jgi:hypothetical protein
MQHEMGWRGGWIADSNDSSFIKNIINTKFYIKMPDSK